MSASTEQNVDKRLAAGFPRGLTIYGIPTTTTHTAFNVPADMTSAMKANTAANKSVQMRANMATSSTIDDSSDDQRSDYTLIQCMNAFITRLHLLGEAKILLLSLYLTFVLYLGALPTRFNSRAGEQTLIWWLLLAGFNHWIWHSSDCYSLSVRVVTDIHLDVDLHNIIVSPSTILIL